MPSPGTFFAVVGSCSHLVAAAPPDPDPAKWPLIEEDEMKRQGYAVLIIAALAAPSAMMAQEEIPGMPDISPDQQEQTTQGLATADCEEQHRLFDINGDGFISQSESERDFARAGIDGVTIGPDGLTRDQFLAICAADSWSQHTPEAGAPLEGANSFTEEQARQRAIAWNVTDVSALALDEQGVWRGTGKVGTDAVAVAIDYKGNVVTTPAAQ